MAAKGVGDGVVEEGTEGELAPIGALYEMGGPPVVFFRTRPGGIAVEFARENEPDVAAVFLDWARRYARWEGASLAISARFAP